MYPFRDCDFLPIAIAIFISISISISIPDASSPFVGSYPFRTSERAAASGAGWATRDVEAERALAAGLAAHFAVPEIAAQDATVAQGLQYPQRYVCYCLHVVNVCKHGCMLNVRMYVCTYVCMYVCVILRRLVCVMFVVRAQN